jgi:hypothetical protein
MLGVTLGSLVAAGPSASAKVPLTRASLVSAIPQDQGTVTAQSASFGTPENSTLTEVPGTLQLGEQDTDGNPNGNQCCTAALYEAPNNGGVSLDSNGDGGFTYTPNSGFSGTDSFEFVLTDGDGNVSAPATVTVNVDPLAASDSEYSLAQNQSFTAPAGILQAGASDGDNSATCCTASLSSAASDGTVTLDSDGDGGFNYTPDSGYVGSDSFSYVLTDSDGNVSAPAQVTLDVANAGTGVTNTNIVSIEPPAADPTTPVTITVAVSPAGSGATPTGRVTLTYYTVGLERGGPFTGTIATVVLSDGEATYTTTANQLPPGGPDNGSITIHATYNGDKAYAASNGLEIYYVEPTCSQSQWNGNGYPNVVSGGETGYYIGQSNGWFTVYVTHNTGGEMKFTGSVTTYGNGLLLYVASTKNEGHDNIKLVGSTKVIFKLVNQGAIDGFTFYAGCGTKVKMDLNIGKKPAQWANTSQMFIGNPTSAGKRPGSYTFKRS